MSEVKPVNCSIHLTPTQNKILVYGAIVVIALGILTAIVASNPGYNPSMCWGLYVGVVVAPYILLAIGNVVSSIKY